MAMTEAQKKANAKYRMNNREKTNYSRFKSTAKCFILNKATVEDLKYMKGLIVERLKEED